MKPVQDRHRRRNVPDSFERKLEQLLEYSEAPQAEAFTMDVMRIVRREQRRRKIILWSFGLVGALFGLSGALMLTGPVSELLTFSLEMPVMKTMQVTLFVVGATAFYLWFMNDDFSLGS
jgi:hypothetical protein